MVEARASLSQMTTDVSEARRKLALEMEGRAVAEAQVGRRRPHTILRVMRQAGTTGAAV